MAEDKVSIKPKVQAPNVYQSETLDPGALRLKVRSSDVDEQPARKTPLKGSTVPQTREMVLKLIERFKRL